MRRSSLVVCLVLAVACSDKPADDGATGADGGTTSGGGDSTTFGPTSAGSASATTTGTTATSTTTSADTGDTGPADDTAGFVMPPDSGGASECDPLAQDCREGQKCTAWANDGGSVWNANKCVEETGTGVAGDPCLVEGSGVSGLDDCAKGYICLFADDMNMGVCIAFCSGADETCENPDDSCVVANNGVLPLCLDACDPLIQDCPAGQACYDSPAGVFVCFADASGAAGLDGDPCPPSDGENTCDPGLWCGPGSNGCVDVNCCTPYCDLAAPDCAAPDECVSYYGDPGNAPPGFEGVGVCVLP
jgi:hypothetical protein